MALEPWQEIGRLICDVPQVGDKFRAVPGDPAAYLPCRTEDRSLRKRQSLMGLPANTTLATPSGVSAVASGRFCFVIAAISYRYPTQIQLPTI